MAQQRPRRRTAQGRVLHQRSGSPPGRRRHPRALQAQGPRLACCLEQARCSLPRPMHCCGTAAPPVLRQVVQQLAGWRLARSGAAACPGRPRVWGRLRDAMPCLAGLVRRFGSCANLAQSLAAGLRPEGLWPAQAAMRGFASGPGAALVRHLLPGLALRVGRGCCRPMAASESR